MLFRISFNPNLFSALRLVRLYTRSGMLGFRSLMGWFSFNNRIVFDFISTGLSCEATTALNIPMAISTRMHEAKITPNILASKYLKKLFMVLELYVITQQY